MSGAAYAIEPTDPVEKLLLDFSRRHNINMPSLRELYSQFIFDHPQAFASPAAHVAATEHFLAGLLHDLNGNKIVLSSPKARNGFSRARQRQLDKTRKPIAGPGKLRSRKERETVAAKLKEHRRKN